MTPESKTISIRTRTEVAAFSRGRLVGDLILRYRLDAERAEAIAVATDDIVATASALTEATEFTGGHVRAIVEGLQQGHSVAQRITILVEETKQRGRPLRRSITCAEFRRQLRTKIGASEAFAAYRSVLIGRMVGASVNGLAFEAGEKSPGGRLAATLTEILVEKHDLTPELADRFAALLMDNTKLALHDAAGSNAKADPDKEEDEERLFWRFVRWLAELLRDLVHDEDCDEHDDDDGDDPSDTGPPSVFGEEMSGWLLDHECVTLKAVRLQEGSDEITVTGTYAYLGRTGALSPTPEIEFGRPGHSPPINHRLARVGLSSQHGVYTAVHVLQEEDLLSEEWATAVGEALGGAVASAVSSGLPSVAAGLAGMATDLVTGGLGGAFVETALETVFDQVLGDAIDAASEIISDAIGSAIASALGPEAFQPIMAIVPVLWPNPNEPLWLVRHGPSSRGAHPGSIPDAQIGRGTRLAGPRPGTGGSELIVASRGTTRGLYTYQFRFFVYQAP